MNEKQNFVDWLNYYDPLHIYFKGESKLTVVKSSIALKIHQCQMFINTLHFSMVLIEQVFSFKSSRFQANI